MRHHATTHITVGAMQMTLIMLMNALILMWLLWMLLLLLMLLLLRWKTRLRFHHHHAAGGLHLVIHQRGLRSNYLCGRQGKEIIAVLGGQVRLVVATSLGVHRLVRVQIPDRIVTGIQALLAAQDFRGQDDRHRLCREVIAIIVVVVVVGVGHEGDGAWIERIHRRTQRSSFESGGRRRRRITMCPALEVRQNHRAPAAVEFPQKNRKASTVNSEKTLLCVRTVLYEIVRRTAGAYFSPN